MLQRTLLSVSVMALVTPTVQAQRWAEKMFEIRSHDFGTTARKAKAEYRFVLKNIYAEDVHVAGVRGSCGCASVQIEKPLLKTYEQGAIIATVNSDKFTGRQDSTITVTIDKPRHATVQLQVKVDIEPDVLVEPASVQFGDVDQGTVAEKTVAVSCRRHKGWEILDVKTANPHLSTEVVETVRSEGRVTYELHVRLGQDAPTGYVREHLIVVTNDKPPKQIPILAEGRVVSAITITPESLFLGTVQAGQSVTKQFVVRGRKPFCITSITADCDCFEFGGAVSEVARAFHVVPVTLKAPEKVGKIAKAIRISTDLDHSPVEVRIYAAVTRG